MIHQLQLLKKINCTVNNAVGEKAYNHLVAFCVDKGYLPFALFATQQLLAQPREFDICICLPNLQDVPEEFLQLPIRFIELEISGIDDLPVEHLSLAAYNRLFLPHIFADEYEYIVYLDADTYILRPFFSDLMELVATFDDFCVASAADTYELFDLVEFKKIRRGQRKKYQDTYNEKHLYRNSGVLVFHVENCVKQGFAEQVFAYTLEKDANLLYHDQSALNRAFMNNMTVLPFEFNWQLHEINYRLIPKRKPYILHFIANSKPWSYDYPFTRPYIKSYEDFLSKHFPDSKKALLTNYLIRKENPKHKNKIKEFFNREWSRLVQPISLITRNIKYALGRNQEVSRAIDTINQHKPAFKQ
ncbi:MAG: hypothetical protein CR974_00985 [Gammaproteobacteria bacterium]|nr:MAG: hypothetical protein CR974_00985 [Gammaproteobacteria bacterium]